MNFARQTVLFTVAAATLFATDTSAQFRTQQKSKNYAGAYGQRHVGGSFRIQTRAQTSGNRTRGSVAVSGNAAATVRVFRWSREAIGIDVGASASGTIGSRHNTIRNHGALRLAGYTVGRLSHNRELTAEKTIKTGPKAVLRVSKTFLVGPVPVLVSASVGAGGGLKLGASQDARNLRMTAYAEPFAYAYGDLSGGVGVDYRVIAASAGVRGQLKFANTKVRGSYNVAPRTIGGTLSMTMEAVRFTIFLYATVKLGRRQKGHSLPIASWAAGIKRWNWLLR